MKRTFAFMMALVLVFSLAATAFAAGGTNGTITINNAVKETEYAVYKIFDATYEGANVTYTITKANPFFVKLFGSNDDTVNQTNDYFKYFAETGVVVRNTEKGMTDAQLFEYLEALIAGVTPTATKKAESTTVEFTGLATGYYVIQRTNGSANAVTITTVKPNANVNDKNELPGGDFDKSSDKNVVGVGDTINWTVSFTATNYAGEEKVYCYTVKDALNRDWAAIDSSSIKVYVDDEGNGVDNDDVISDWTLKSDPAQTNGFEIDIPWVNLDGEGNFVSFKYPATAVVKITYSATVLDAAAANNPSTPNRNDADLEWDTESTPDVPGSGDGTDADVYNLGFTKVDGTSGAGLAGAEFELTDSNGNPVYVSGSDGVYVVDATSTSNKVVTPEDGVVVIKGLEETGTYYLTETKAPDGYNMLTAPVEVTIVADVKDKDGNVTTQNGTTLNTYYVNHVELDIQNFSGVELPSTGGEGTIMMITFGTMVALAFAVLMITQKKMSIYQD